MSAQRVTVSLPSEIVERARVAVASGAAASVSAYVADAMRAKQEKAAALAALTNVLGGRPPVDELNTVRRRWGLPQLPGA